MNNIINKIALSVSLLMPFLLIFSLIPRFTGSIPSNYFSSSTQENINILYLQGWSFFTRDVRGKVSYAYILKDNYLYDPYPDAFSVGSYFGISRWHRTGNLDMAIIVDKIIKEGIEPAGCTVEDIIQCANEKSVEKFEISLSHKHEWCGKIVIEHRYAHPYSYREFDRGKSINEIWVVDVKR